jgi:hypothetical protein
MAKKHTSTSTEFTKTGLPAKKFRNLIGDKSDQFSKKRQAVLPNTEKHAIPTNKKQKADLLLSLRLRKAVQNDPNIVLPPKRTSPTVRIDTFQLGLDRDPMVGNLR